MTELHVVITSKTTKKVVYARANALGHESNFETAISFICSEIQPEGFEPHDKSCLDNAQMNKLRITH